MSFRTALPMAAAVLAGSLAASAAQARTEVSVQINLPLPVVLRAPVLQPAPMAPVVVLPRAQPAPVYVQPGWTPYPPAYTPVYVQTRPTVVGYRADRDRDGIPDRYDRYDNRRLPATKAHDHRHHGKRGDDRDRHGRNDRR